MFLTAITTEYVRVETVKDAKKPWCYWFSQYVLYSEEIKPVSAGTVTTTGGLDVGTTVSENKQEDLVSLR